MYLMTEHLHKHKPEASDQALTRNLLGKYIRTINQGVEEAKVEDWT